MSGPDAAALLRELVGIASVSGDEARAVRRLVERMAQLGLAAHVDAAGNAVGVRERPDAAGAVSREIVLLGHIDTVPGAVAVREEHGVLYGRGTVDAKGPLVAFVVAAATADLPPGTRVVVIGAVEEECATSRGARHAAACYTPDWCIIGEPSGWDGVTLGYKGRLLVEVTLVRPNHHSAGRERGSAETAVDWWNALTAHAAAFNRDRPRLFDQLLPSLRAFHTANDGLDDRAVLTAGLRLPPDCDVDALLTAARGWAPAATLRAYAHEPAFQSDRRHDLARAFNRALRAAGATPRYKLKTGTSDMNVVGPLWGCPIVAYGPGDSALDHTPDEHLDLDHLRRAVAVLQGVLAYPAESTEANR